MLQPVLPDSDVLVDYLRGLPQAVALVERYEVRIVLSAIVVAEVYAGARYGRDREILARLVSLFPVVPVTAEVARTGGLLKLDYGPSHGIGLPDALVAATVLQEKADLKTLNVKHYPMLAGLKPAYVRTDISAVE